MVVMILFIILGSIFVIFLVFLNMFGENNLISKFIFNNLVILDLLVSFFIGLIGLYVCMCIVFNLGNYYKLYILGCVVLLIFFFLFLVVLFILDGVLEIGNLGVKGLFIGMIVGFGFVELYNFCNKKNIIIKMLENVFDFVFRFFELIFIIIIVCGIFIVVCFILLKVFGELFL